MPALPAEGEAERREACRRFNATVLARPSSTSGHGNTLASPVMGSGVQMGYRTVLVLSGVLRPERSVEVSTAGGVVHEVRHRATVPHLFDALLYGPAVRVALAGAGVARRLQSGSLRLYIGYLVGLVLLLLLLARAGALA